MTNLTPEDAVRALNGPNVHKELLLPASGSILDKLCAANFRKSAVLKISANCNSCVRDALHALLGDNAPDAMPILSGNIYTGAIPPSIETYEVPERQILKLQEAGVKIPHIEKLRQPASASGIAVRQ